MNTSQVYVRMDSEEPRVTVSVRIRPKLAFAANALQQSERYEEVICVPTSDSSLRLAERRAAKVNRNLHFAYDHVFDVDTTQEEVYETAGLDCVDGVLRGTSASFLTYGQTGSGKTFTVLGRAARREEGEAVGPDSGLLLRAINDMLAFSEVMRQKRQRHVVLGITAIEIYNDEIRDLLREGGVAAGPLQPIMTRDALHFPGLTHVPLCSLRDACAVYERAAARRAQRATSANDTSSRSHAIFTVEVFQAPVSPSCVCAPALAECCALRDAQLAATGWSARSSPSLPRSECFDGAPNVLATEQGVSVMYSALTVADLAGSEKAKHADVRGAGFDELRRINASLTALGNVVHHLYHGSSHVPYRDSKLTMVLRDTFAAPHARVVLFVNVSPTALTCDETLSSLYFADKMKGMAVSDAATSPQQAALQASYLASLREHDTLLAELHIFHVQQELSAGPLLLQCATASAPDDHPLLQLPFHIAPRDSPDKARRLRQLCAQLQAATALAESPEVRQQRFADVARREARRAILQQYSQRRAEVHAQTAAAEQANKVVRQELAEMEAVMRQTLSAAKADTQKVASQRQALSQAKAAQLAALAGLGDDAVSIASDRNDESSNDDTAQNTYLPRADSLDTAVDSTIRAALEAAQLRLTMLELVAFNVRTDPVPSSPAPTPCIDGDRARSATVSRSRSGTASSACQTKHATVEEWVRGAVLAMAGNAVVQSTKRTAKPRQRAGEATSRGATAPLPLAVITNNLLAATSLPSRKTRQLPKYWKVLQQTRGQENHPPGKKGVRDIAAVETTRTARDFRSAFDDPQLFTRVTAYMDMGASLIKVDRTGHPRPRWFYLAQKEDRLLLCWDESRRGANLSGGGHVYLDAVEKIILGRSSPGFLKYASVAENTAADAKADACNSFTVVYHSRANHRDFKFVDVICPNKNEMETWVVGLGHCAGVLPIFEDARQPGDTAADEHNQQMENGEAAAEMTMTAQEAVLSRMWHIPADVLLKTRHEVDMRRLRHHSGRLRLTPGELRDLTGLDIFRASALWCHFEKVGWVSNPTRQLRCFANLDEFGQATTAAM